MNIKQNKVTPQSLYKVKRNRGRSSWTVVSPFDWEADRKYNDRSAAEFTMICKNAALMNAAKAKA